LTGAGKFNVNEKESYSFSILAFYHLYHRRGDFLYITFTTLGQKPYLKDSRAHMMNVRNTFIGWVRRKGELIGVIRIANKGNTGFVEESAKLVGIL